MLIKFQLPCYVQGRQPPDQDAQSLALNASRDGASTDIYIYTYIYTYLYAQVSLRHLARQGAGCIVKLFFSQGAQMEIGGFA